MTPAVIEMPRLLSLRELAQLTELLRHLTGGDSRYEQERLRLVCDLRDELRRRTGAMHQGEVA